MSRRRFYNPHRPYTSIESETFDPVYDHDLQMYEIPPNSGHVHLEELYKWTIDRLQVLGYVAEVEEKHMSFQRRLPALLRLLEENNLKEYAMFYDIKSNCDWRMKRRYILLDSVAHFFLKLAFAFDFKKKKWFIKQEKHLFAWRLCSLPLNSVYRFMELNGIEYPTISSNERNELRTVLENYDTRKVVEKVNFYKVEFTHVLSLVRHRQVHLKNGIAYVPESKINHLIHHRFSKALYSTFIDAQTVHSANTSDPRCARLMQLLLTSAERYTKPIHRPDQITYAQLDELAERSYPLCMRIIHEALRRNHHLKNGARVQYTLFLKGIGLSMQDALKLWRIEFCKKMTQQQFNKEYRYYCVHLYGQAGRMADYQPFRCMKIINSPVLPNDCHGCPYKILPIPSLKATLREHGLLRHDVEEIITLAEKKEYLQACKMYYEVRHNIVLNDPFTHPNDYFRSSYERFREAEESDQETDEEKDEKDNEDDIEENIEKYVEENIEENIDENIEEKIDENIEKNIEEEKENDKKNDEEYYEGNYEKSDEEN